MEGNTNEKVHEREFDIPDNSLIIMVGVAGSGKSSLARRLACNDEEMIVSTDTIREERVRKN